MSDDTFCSSYLHFWTLNKIPNYMYTNKSITSTKHYFPDLNSWSLLLLNTWSHFWVRAQQEISLHYLLTRSMIYGDSQENWNILCHHGSVHHNFNTIPSENKMIILVENTSLSHRRTSKLSRAKSKENCSSWDFHSNDPELIFYVITANTSMLYYEA